MSADYFLTNGFYTGEPFSPVTRFCISNNCRQVVFQRESDLCDFCTARIRPYPSFASNNCIHDDASHQTVTHTDFPHELRGNGVIDGGVPPAPSIMQSRRHPNRHMPPSAAFQQPQAISPFRDRMRSNYLPDTFFEGAHIFDPVLPFNTRYATTSLPYGITQQDRQPTLQSPSLNCEKCGIFMPEMGNGRLCSNCLITNQNRKLTIPAKPSSAFSNPDSLKYRDIIDLTGIDHDRPLMTDTANTSAPPIRIKGSPQDQLLHSRRQKLPIETVKGVDQPIIAEVNNTTEGNALKKCSTGNCNRSIPVESCGSRCMSCVKLDWKSVKVRRLNTSVSHQEGKLPPSAKSTSNKPRKSVTWSDTVTVASGDGTVVQCLARDVEEVRLSVVDDVEPDRKNVNTIRNEGYTSTEIDLVISTSTVLEPQPSAGETQEVPLTPPENPNTQISGWDSDLSELTESDEDDNSPPTSTGLKIKIPARTTIFCSRKCRNPWCNQVLAIDYPKKTCMICRVQHRQNKNKRRQDGVDDDAVMLDGNPPRLVANARLCSASKCTHFIPPDQEYKFKRCDLCRLYQEEWRLLRRQRPIPRSNSIETLVDVMKIYNLFGLLPIRFPTPGRCRSLDCGVIHEDGSTSCQQCVSRRTRLMGKARIQEHKQNKPPPELNLYPQYRCYAFLLSDFGSRLKAFLESRAIFFWFKNDQPSLIGTKALFSFDGEFSVVTLDLDVISRQDTIDARALKTKKDLEDIEGLKFAPKRLISVLEGGAVAIRFSCTYQALILRPMKGENVTTVSKTVKPMTGELEIAVFPDRSHRFLPGEKTIIRFRLLG